MPKSERDIVQLTVRIPRSTQRKLAALAVREERSLNSLVRVILRQHVDREASSA